MHWIATCNLLLNQLSSLKWIQQLIKMLQDLFVKVKISIDRRVGGKISLTVSIIRKLSEKVTLVKFQIQVSLLIEVQLIWMSLVMRTFQMKSNRRLKKRKIAIKNQLARQLPLIRLDKKVLMIRKIKFLCNSVSNHLELQPKG